MVETTISVSDIGCYKVEAKLNGQLVGELEAFPMVGLVHIKVEEKHQSQGIGTDILNCYVSELKRRQFARCVLTTHKVNVPMMRICEKLGFQCGPQEAGNDGLGDTVCMLTF